MRRRWDEVKEGVGRLGRPGRREPCRRMPRQHPAASMPTTTHAMSIPSRVHANHVDGEDNASHVDAQPRRRRDLSLPPLYCSHNVMNHI